MNGRLTDMSGGSASTAELATRPPVLRTEFCRALDCHLLGPALSSPHPTSIARHPRWHPCNREGSKPPLPTHQHLLKQALERPADALDLLVGHAPEEG